MRALLPRPRQVPPFHGDPLTFSYWLVSNLPLDDRTRQRLLQAKTGAVPAALTASRVLPQLASTT